VRSLSHRTRFADAIALGLAELRECGVDVPAADGIGPELDRSFGRLHQWLDETDPADDLARPELTDPTLLATARLIDAVLPVGYFVADIAMVAWLGLEALRIWTEHGTSPALVGPVAHGAYHAAPQRGEHSAAYRGLRRIVALGEARGYDPGTSQARHMLAAVTCWFEPIEHGVREAHRAREGLIAGDDLAYAGYTYQLSVPYLTDCAPSLDGLAAEVDAGQRFLRITGNEQTSQWLDSYQWLAGVLRGEHGAGDALRSDRYADNPLPLLYAHLALALAAAVLEDPDGLAQHSAAVVPLLPVAAGSYATAVGQLLRGLSVAWQARGADREQRGALLAECDEVTGWLAARTADAPQNFLHLLRLVEAERAWAVGDFRAALLAFDAARRAVAERERPWHRALITERAARFHLAHGLEQAGFELLAQARQAYVAWGASAKVGRLDWAYPPQAPVAGRDDSAGRGGAVSSGTIDLLGILAASQALSSETSVERLHRRVVDVLGAMTGATGVHLVLWDDERGEWVLPAAAGHGDPVAGPGLEQAVPMSVLRYTQRVGEPLVVADAGRDDRFARDPYLAGVDCCSVLVVPVLSRGSLRGAVVLENRLIRGAFSAGRLDAVKLIAGQLAVSLDNAKLYGELAGSRGRIVAAADEARRRIERDLHDGAQQRLVHAIVVLKLARRQVGDVGDPLAETLADALENVERANEEMRELARGIHPRILSSEGLGPALERLTARSTLPVTLEVRADAELGERVGVSAYYVVSEALTNAVKHAGATAMRVAVDTAGGLLRLSVSDDGAGGADPAGGSGLTGLRDRVEALDGTFVVDSRAGEGTRLFVEIPLDAG
jgi:signal transduction histidine kinase